MILTGRVIITPRQIAFVAASQRQICTDKQKLFTREVFAGEGAEELSAVAALMCEERPALVWLRFTVHSLHYRGLMKRIICAPCSCRPLRANTHTHTPAALGSSLLAGRRHCSNIHVCALFQCGSNETSAINMSRLFTHEQSISCFFGQSRALLSTWQPLFLSSN